MNMKTKRLAPAVCLFLALMLFLLSACGSGHSVKLIVNGEERETLKVSAKEPFAAAEPEIPGWRFVGWFTAEEPSAGFDPASAIESDRTLYAGFSDLFRGGLDFHPTARALEPLEEDFRVFDEFGKVEAVSLTDDGVLIRAVGNYGVHMDQSPTVTMGVGISGEGLVTGVWMLDSYAQTEGFPEQITAAYLQEAYEGEFALPDMRISPVSGASAPSRAVLYAVRTASHYAKNVYGFFSETLSQSLAELNEVCPAEYAPVSSEYQPDPKKLGTVLFAGEGTTADGRNVLAMKVEGAQSFNWDGAYRAPYDSAKPNPYVLIIVVDTDSREVLSYRVVENGTRKTEYFTVPQDKLDAYLGVVIDSEESFDSFTDGLVKDYDSEWEYTMDEYSRKTITGSSVVYTGTTADGTLSGQMVRNCYRTAARYLWNYR